MTFRAIANVNKQNILTAHENEMLHIEKFDTFAFIFVLPFSWSVFTLTLYSVSHAVVHLMIMHLNYQLFYFPLMDNKI